MKKSRQGRREKPNPAATGANAATATAIGGKGQKKKKKARDVSEVTCYSCNKKSHHASDYTEPQNELQSRQPPRRSLLVRRLMLVPRL